MRFLKYRHRFASGIEKRFYFKLLDEEEDKYSEEDIKCLVEELTDEYSYSDTYRGIEYFVVNVDDLLDKDKKDLVKKYNDKIKNYQQNIDTCQRIIKRLTIFTTW